MKKTIKRIIYKHYLTVLVLSVWSGIFLVFDINDEKMFWGIFLIISGVSLLLSEKNFIKTCNDENISVKPDYKYAPPEHFNCRSSHIEPDNPWPRPDKEK